MKFKNPSNGYVQKANFAFLWCLLFGVFYFIKHGAWTQAVIAFGVSFVTFGAGWFFVPFFAKGMIRKSYLTKGWIEITDPDGPWKAANDARFARETGPSDLARKASAETIAANLAGR